MNVSFEYYRIFYYVAKYGNFTRAARVLGNSQPNLTRTINLLEQQTRCTLFTRTNRGVRLTPEGERLYARVSAAMTQLQAAEAELSASAGLEHGSVAIGASETAMNLYLLDRLRSFHTAYPGIRLKICSYVTPQALRSVKNGEVDFAVVTTPMEAEPPLKEIRLQAFQEILVGGREFSPLADSMLSLKDLKNYPLICMGRETVTYGFYRQLFLSHGLELEPDIEAAATDQILSLVRCGLGLAFLPEPMTRTALEAGELLQIPLKEQIPPRQISLVYDRQRPLNAAAQALRREVTGQGTKTMS